MKAYPNVPTVAESVPGFESLNGAITKALESPAIRTRLQAESLDPAGSSSAAFADFIVKDIARYEKIVKATGAKPK